MTVLVDRRDVPVVGVMIPPAEGSWVRVATDSGLVCGWLVADAPDAPGGVDAAGDGVEVAVVPAAPGAQVVFTGLTGDLLMSMVPADEAADRPHWWDRVVPSVRAALVARRQSAAARAACAAAEQATVAACDGHARWVDDLVDSAHEWADENSLCGEFDRFMSAHGLPGREREFTVTLEVSVKVETTVRVYARSEADAQNKDLDLGDVAEAVYRSLDANADGVAEICEFSVLAAEES